MLLRSIFWKTSYARDYIYLCVYIRTQHNYLKADNMEVDEVDNKGRYLFIIKHFSVPSNEPGIGETRHRHNNCSQKINSLVRIETGSSFVIHD